MDANQIEKLKALALAATPGPWRASLDSVFAGPRYRVVPRVTAGGSAQGMVDEMQWAHANAVFIATANPAAVLELIAEVERLRATPTAGTAERDAILEQAAAIADAERAEFMEQSCKNNGRESDFAFGSVNSAERIAASIRAIKSDAIAAHTKAGKDNA